MKIKMADGTFELPAKLLPFVKTTVGANGKTYIKITSEQHARALAQRVAPIDAIKPTNYQWQVVEA